MRGRWMSVAGLVAFVASGVPAGAAAAPPDVTGPDIPAVTKPVAIAHPFTHEVFSCADEVRHATIAVPAAYNRVVLEFTYESRTDPWDRLFAVTIGGAEVLRGTTPRTDFKVQKDVTEFASLMPRGGIADVGLSVGSFVGEVAASVRVLFYAHDPTAALVRPPASAVIAPFALRELDGDGQRLTAPATQFPSAPPSSADVEITLSGHGDEEFWYQSNDPTPRTFDVVVDGTTIATATALPYSYALLGFGGPNANIACSGPGNSAEGDLLHPLMWWTAQRVLDLMGVHLGVGEIPPYRAHVTAKQLALLRGARTVEVVQHGGTARWVTSLAFLLES